MGPRSRIGIIVDLFNIDKIALVGTRLNVLEYSTEHENLK